MLKEINFARLILDVYDERERKLYYNEEIADFEISDDDAYKFYRLIAAAHNTFVQHKLPNPAKEWAKLNLNK